MASTDVSGNTSTQLPEVGTIDMKLEVSEVFHNAAGPVPGPDPQHRSYQTYASFSDPDGNECLLQEITTRLPGREWED